MIIGIRNKCSSEIRLNNNDNDNKKAIRNTMASLKILSSLATKN